LERPGYKQLDDIVRQILLGLRSRSLPQLQSLPGRLLDFVSIWEFTTVIGLPRLVHAYEEFSESQSQFIIPREQELGKKWAKIEIDSKLSIYQNYYLN
jgi:hypothetical protein